MVTDEHLETMVVACVGVLKDKGGSNQMRMLKWLSQKLVDQVCTAFPPPHFSPLGSSLSLCLTQLCLDAGRYGAAAAQRKEAPPCGA